MYELHLGRNKYSLRVSNMRSNRICNAHESCFVFFTVTLFIVDKNENKIAMLVTRNG